MTPPIPPDVTAWIDEEGWLLISEEKPGRRYVRISPYFTKLIAAWVVAREFEMDGKLDDPEDIDARFGVLDEDGGYEEEVT
jgi:hypothetical protein